MLASNAVAIVEIDLRDDGVVIVAARVSDQVRAKADATLLLVIEKVSSWPVAPGVVGTSAGLLESTVTSSSPPTSRLMRFESTSSGPPPVSIARARGVADGRAVRSEGWPALAAQTRPAAREVNKRVEADASRPHRRFHHHFNLEQVGPWSPQSSIKGNFWLKSRKKDAF